MPGPNPATPLGRLGIDSPPAGPTAAGPAMAFCCARSGPAATVQQHAPEKHDSFQYESLSAAAVTPGLVAQLRRHAIVVWFAMPAFATAQGLVRLLHPTCAFGYSNYSLIGVVLVLAHHLYAESKAWAAVKLLCTQPELCVLRQLGVLRRRRRLVVLGLLQDLHLYANLMFPLIARGCDLKIAENYQTAWEIVPGIGPLVVWVLEYLRFWGFAILLMGVFVALSVGELCHHHAIWPTDAAKRGGDDGGQARMLGSDFVNLARYAEVAFFPSIVALCEEMSERRRHVYVDNDAGTEVQARRKLTLGRIRAEDFQKMELASNEENDRVVEKQQVHLLIQLSLKVLTGVILQLWVQASFFELAFDTAGDEAKSKVVAGMLISAVLVFATALRFCDATSKLGCVGVVLFIVCALAIAWTVAKVYFAWVCDDHLWNLSTGCVSLGLNRH